MQWDDSLSCIYTCPPLPSELTTSSTLTYVLEHHEWLREDITGKFHIDLVSLSLLHVLSERDVVTGHSAVEGSSGNRWMSGLGLVSGSDADGIAGALIATHSRKLQVGTRKSDMLSNYCFYCYLRDTVSSYYRSTILDLEHPIPLCYLLLWYLLLLLEQWLWDYHAVSLDTMVL